MLDAFWTLAETHTFQWASAVVLSAAWVASEYYARRATWRKGAVRKPSSAMDRATYPVIAISLAIGMIASTVFFLSGLGGYFPWWVTLVGLPVMVTGLYVRVWALTTLGRFFTMPITIREDHEIVKEGPYRWVRHPAYTGGLLTALGVPLLLGTPLGLLVAFVACFAAYVHRIRIEEGVLRSRFGKGYEEYERGTWRLLPGLY